MAANDHRWQLAYRLPGMVVALSSLPHSNRPSAGQFAMTFPISFVRLGAFGLLGCGPATTASTDPLQGSASDSDASVTQVPETDDLRSVSGVSAQDVWAVGAGGAIRHFDGRAWRLVDSGGVIEDLT